MPSRKLTLPSELIVEAAEKVVYVAKPIIQATRKPSLASQAIREDAERVLFIAHKTFFHPTEDWRQDAAN